VGEVVERDGEFRGNGDKEWLLDFDGWNLPIYCFVNWRKVPENTPFPSLTRGTICRYTSVEGHRLCEEYLENLEIEPIIDEPTETEPVSDKQLLSMLIDEGLRPGSAEELTQALARIRLLAEYYIHKYQGNDISWADVREHETRTFLVMPLLLALGWTEQQIKIEQPAGNRKRIDIACFSKPYHQEERECLMIIETKGLSQGLDYAGVQAKAYSKAYKRCHLIVVTNGYVYKAFEKTDGVFHDEVTAYLNLLTPTKEYPLNPRNGNGALKMMRMLLPKPFDIK
jgi:hypothetical protein